MSDQFTVTQVMAPGVAETVQAEMLRLLPEMAKKIEEAWKQRRGVRCSPTTSRVYLQLVALYEAIPHNGEPGSALRRECEATKKLIRELETGHA